MNKRPSLLLSPDPAESASNTPEAVAEVPAAPEIVAPPPPAATTVAEGAITEETLRLRREKAELADELKAREIEIAEARDAHERYRKSVEEPAPVKVKQKPDEPSRRFGFLNR